MRIAGSRQELVGIYEVLGKLLRTDGRCWEFGIACSCWELLGIAGGFCELLGMLGERFKPAIWQWPSKKCKGWQCKKVPFHASMLCHGLENDCKIYECLLTCWLSLLACLFTTQPDTIA